MTLRRVLVIVALAAFTMAPGTQPVSAGNGVPPIEVISVRLWVKGTTVWGVGEVRNTSAEWIYPMAGVDFRDACGTGGLGQITLPQPLAPGARGTFIGAASRSCAPGTPTVTGTLAWGLVNPASTGGIGIRRQPTELVPNTTTQMMTARGGIVHNPLPFAVDITALGVTFYNASGVAVSAGWISTLVTLGPGEEASAELSGHLRPGIVSARLTLSARRTADPHAPITTFDNYFIDSLRSPFLDDVSWLADRGITTGCGTHRFCPDAAVTRAQMASFLARALNLSSTTTDHFTDDAGSVHQADINRLRAAGITTGCTATTYCPNAPVTRAQMAAFLARALDLPPASTDYFTDDAGSTHQADINRLRAAGITTGCTATTYCPNAPVTRAQMAAFLHRAMPD